VRPRRAGGGRRLHGATRPRRAEAEEGAAGGEQAGRGLESTCGMAAGAILGRQVPRREAAGGADAKTRRVAPSRSAKLQAWSSSAADEIRRGRGRRARTPPPRSAELQAAEL